MTHTEMTYKGFIATCRFSESQGIYLAKVVNCKDTLLSRGYSPDQAESAFRFCVDTYLDVCRQKGISTNQTPQVIHV